ncbi:Cof-type HAD-IIB family hydrolase [Salipaludibacillus sp. HK11]|uniref:Cof-type HAD-IIB family hydrolase n=1 Tax=Salipaludibacillus sp. HK11 TaxID=3394320 RepID=UPI0039FBA064
MTKIKLIATDMDGTLLDEARAVSTENIRIIKEAQRLGIKVIVATGRDYTEAVFPLKEAGLRLPLICVNGADIRKEDGEILHQQTLSTEQFKKMDRILTEEEVYFEIYTSKGAYTNDEKQGLQLVVDVLLTTGAYSSYDNALKLAEKRFEEGAINRVDNYLTLLEKSGYQLFKLLAFSKDDVKRERAKRRLEEELEITISASANDNLEITNKSATKGNGLEIMSKHYNIDLPETMVLGDNFNDVSMMKVAGYAVAMENADPVIKALCDLVTKSNEEDGVAHAIQKVIPNL